jgi:hypothetical protein
MILSNGTPKAGTHLPLIAVRLFDGMNTAGVHNHLRCGEDLSKYSHHIHIIRNPRNILFSWMKFTKVELTRENIINEIPVTLQRIKDFEGYLTDPNTLTVRFELMLTDPQELQKIADYLELPLIDDHFKKIWGRGPTFMTDKVQNKHTDWRDYWNDTYEGVWSFHGGYEVENALNYNPHKEYHG